MKEYIISDGTVSAAILPEKGATAVSLKKDGTEFLYRWDENLNSPERPRCGIPFLFPTFGRMKEETYSWNGQSYHMAIHGFAHTSPWNVESSTEDTLVLTLEGPVPGVYPFAFFVRLTFAIREGALEIRQAYENRGSEPMPYAFGFHPYFQIGKLENAAVSTTADSSLDFAAGKVVPFGAGSLTLTEPETMPEAGAVLMGLKGPVELQIPDTGRKLTMTFSPDFPTLVLWHPKNAAFLCVEPINGTADGFNTGKYMILSPGQKKDVFLTLRPETT